jgi:hypothetical protein
MECESSRANANEGLRWIPVEGDSMWPSLRAGDLAEVEPVAATPRPGEVVLARFDHALVLHRVRSCDARGCSLRGDNVAVGDPLLPPSRILGRVRRVRRGGALLEAERWDVGPKRLGRWRVRVKRRLAAWLGRGGRG